MDLILLPIIIVIIIINVPNKWQVYHQDTLHRNNKTTATEKETVFIILHLMLF